MISPLLPDVLPLVLLMSCDLKLSFIAPSSPVGEYKHNSVEIFLLKFQQLLLLCLFAKSCLSARRQTISGLHYIFPTRGAAFWISCQKGTALRRNTHASHIRRRPLQPFMHMQLIFLAERQEITVQISFSLGQYYSISVISVSHFLAHECMFRENQQSISPRLLLSVVTFLVAHGSYLMIP